MPSINKHYNATTTGAQGSLAGPGGLPLARYSVQLKGVGAAPTSWTLLVEGSNDNANWTTLATHNTGDGSTVFAVDKPVLYARVNLSALSLGSATSVDIYFAANTY
jgi:hypothetical protein